MTEKEIYTAMNEKYEELKKARYEFNLELIEKIELEIFELETELTKIQMKNWTLIGNDNIIDIYKPVATIDGPYFLYFHKLPIEIGEITYRPEYSDTFYGDISYEIDEKYRGNDFALNGLLILIPYLKENGIDKIRIASLEKNIASIKTLESLNENLKNVVITRDATNEAIIYDFDLTKIKHL